MAHRPEILKEFTELFRSVMSKGKIEAFLKWKIALVVSQTLKCPFCVDVTEKMLNKLGASEETIKRIKELTDEEKEILELVKDVTLDGHLDKPELFEKLKEKFNEAKIVEIISVMGLFNYINRFNNTLGILPE
jgi:AhpD family alkylhydroperoxidase